MRPVTNQSRPMRTGPVDALLQPVEFLQDLGRHWAGARMLNMKRKQKRMAAARLITSLTTRMLENRVPKRHISCYLPRAKGWPAWQS